MEELRPIQKLIALGIMALMLISIISFLTTTYAAFVHYDKYEEAGLIQD